MGAACSCGFSRAVQSCGSLRIAMLAHQRQLALGPYPELSLADARDKRTEAKKLLREGFDPAEQKRAREAASQATSDTFREIAREYVAKREREGLAQATLTKKQWLLELADEDLGGMHISEIKPIHVLRALQPVEQRGLHETARRMRSTIGSVCRVRNRHGAHGVRPHVLATRCVYHADCYATRSHHQCRSVRRATARDRRFRRPAGHDGGIETDGACVSQARRA